MKYLLEMREPGAYYLWIDNSGSGFSNVEIARGMSRSQLSNVLHYLHGGPSVMAVRDAKLCLLDEHPSNA